MCFATPNVSPILGRFVKPPNSDNLCGANGDFRRLGAFARVPSCEAQLPQKPTR